VHPRLSPRIAGWSIALAVLSNLTASADPPSAEPRNVVLVVFDDLGCEDLGAWGGTGTPTFDRLAREGVVFEQAYAASSVCSPTRAALLTGRHPVAFGLRAALPGSSRRGVEGRHARLSRLFAEAGFATAHIGKWHLGTARPDYDPRSHGFGHVVRLVGKRGFFDPELEIDGERRVHEGHLTTILTDHAIEFCRRHRGDRFFLNLWYLSIHHPYVPAESFGERHPETQAGRLRAMIEQADHELGRLRAALDELGLTRDTLLVVTSDNGAAKALAGRVSTLRGLKGQLYEGGLRVPLVMHWPAGLDSGQRIQTVALSQDLVPTFAELLGGRPETDGGGVSLVPALSEPSYERSDIVFWEQSAGIRQPYDFAVRSGDWKLVSMGRTEGLFHLGTDPREQDDVRSEHPDVADGLRSAYAAWRLESSRLELSAARDMHEGRVVLAPDVRLDVEDTDLTVLVPVRSPTPGERRLVIGVLPTWRLEAEASGALELSFVDTDGAARTLRASPRSDDRTHAVAFTLQGPSAPRQKLPRPSQVRLYLDAELAARAKIDGLQPNDGVLTLDPRIVSKSEDVRIWASRLTAAEVREVGESLRADARGQGSK